MLNFDIEIDRELEATKPDITVVGKKILLIKVAISLEHKIKVKEDDKLEKYTKVELNYAECRTYRPHNCLIYWGIWCLYDQT